MRPLDLISTALDLTDTGIGRPRESNLRRAVSTTYYALFHCLAECCANLFAGSAPDAQSQPGWQQVYRALNHSTVRNRCQRQKSMSGFPQEIKRFAEMFVNMQEQRHNADYNPDAGFQKAQIVQDIHNAEKIINDFNALPRQERRAFAIYVMFDIRHR